VIDIMVFVYVFNLFHNSIIFGGLLQDICKWKCDIQ